MSRASIPAGPVEVPPFLAANGVLPTEAVWVNEHGTITFFSQGHYVKWTPHDPREDFANERARMDWARPYTPVPEVVSIGGDEHGQALVTRPLPGAGAVTERWRAEPAVAVRAIGEGLRAMHDTLPVETCPWVWREGGDDIVVCHGDPCAPNTIIGDDGRWSGHVDLGALGTASRWADLAVCSMSLDWNFGDGWQPLFFDAYGIARDDDLVAHYRALWNAEP